MSCSQKYIIKRGSFLGQCVDYLTPFWSSMCSWVYDSFWEVLLWRQLLLYVEPSFCPQIVWPWNILFLKHLMIDISRIIKVPRNTIWKIFIKAAYSPSKLMIKNLLCFPLLILHYPLVARRIKHPSASERPELDLSGFSFLGFIVTGNSRICAQVLRWRNVISQVFPSMATTPWESGPNLQRSTQTGWTSPSLLWTTVSRLIFHFLFMSCFGFYPISWPVHSNSLSALKADGLVWGA